MVVPVGLNVWSRLVDQTLPYLDHAAGPFASLWFPDHVQYDGHKVAEGWSLLVFALARYPDKICVGRLGFEFGVNVDPHVRLGGHHPYFVK